MNFFKQRFNEIFDSIAYPNTQRRYDNSPGTISIDITDRRTGQLKSFSGRVRPGFTARKRDDFHIWHEPEQISALFMLCNSHGYSMTWKIKAAPRIIKIPTEKLKDAITKVANDLAALPVGHSHKLQITVRKRSGKWGPIAVEALFNGQMTSHATEAINTFIMACRKAGYVGVAMIQAA